MEDSIANFELTESTVQLPSNPSSEKSDTFEDILADVSHDNSSEAEQNGNGKKLSEDDDFDNNLPETVTLLTHEATGAKVYLVGTAHFSQESKDDVAKVIRAVQPDIVILELCQARTGLLEMDEHTVMEEAKKISMEVIMDKIKRNGVYYGVTYLMLLNLSARITNEIGMAPGGEFRVAFKEAQQIPNCAVLLGDRPIKITILRALSKLSWYQILKLGCHMIFSKEAISKEQVEKCKQKDLLEELLAEMSSEYPQLGEVFVNERDIFLTNCLQDAAITGTRVRQGASTSQPTQPMSPPLRIVSVVGIGHTLGIVRLWPEPQYKYVRAIITIPPPSLSSRIVKAVLKMALLAGGGYLVYRYVPVPRALREGAHKVVAGSWQLINSEVETIRGRVSRIVIAGG